MTNGEKLIETFPSIGLYKKAHDGIQINFNSVWFNAEYKEPTTKNDLSSELDKNSKKLEKDFGELDCISRADVLQILWEYDYTNPNALMLKEIRELPSITPQEPKTGHWIGHRKHCENLGVMPSGLGVYEWCSNCDCGIDVREWDRNHYNYCPNCGADMRGEK